MIPFGNPSRACASQAAAGMRFGCVKETKSTAPKSSGFDPVSAIAFSAAHTQRSTTDVPSAAIRRVRMPVAFSAFSSLATAFPGTQAQTASTATLERVRR